MEHWKGDGQKEALFSAFLFATTYICIPATLSFSNISSGTVTRTLITKRLLSLDFV